MSGTGRARSVAFRLDAATEADALAVITAIRAAGITVSAHHAPRRKRRGDPGVFWDGRIEVPEGDEPR
jgi:hypothetical protein